MIHYGKFVDLLPINKLANHNSIAMKKADAHIHIFVEMENCHILLAGKANHKPHPFL